LIFLLIFRCNYVAILDQSGISYSQYTYTETSRDPRHIPWGVVYHVR